MSPKNWVRLLVDVVEPEDTSKSKIRRRKDLLLAASKENTGSFPKQCFPEQQNWGIFKLSVHAYS